ncbi:DNA-directed RNA polymerase subunit alpha [Candidatus Woesearchaeota archaeon]|nr:DNA-directed RNA polymerase subunit alpha [Candidatus Woesearchaeota archaeon]
MAPRNLLKGFKRPNRILFEHDELKPNYGKFIAEPFEKCYGLTIGNSLRRELLSTIEGARRTAIKIEGVPHEFDTIEGVYEDVVRIILNLKKLRLKYEGDLPKVLHIIKSGPGDLIGEDFNVDPEIEVMNTDLKIATLNDSANIDMEVQVERGRGYIPAEMNKSNTETVGVIPIDSLFSPVEKVNIKVEDTRVGQRTDFDKLILEIWTDGSITPDDALAHAAKIIKDHMTIFINFEEEIEEEVEVVDENLERMRTLLAKSIDEIELSVRSYNTLKSIDISTLENLVRKTEDELRKSKHFSDIILKEVKGKLEELHLSLGLKE